MPNNYEGIRVACDKDNGAGWFLLRLSLHDPVIPLNIESEKNGGVKQIADILFEFLKDFKSLDLTSFDKLKKIAFDNLTILLLNCKDAETSSA